MKKLLLLITLLAGIADPQSTSFPSAIATDAELKVASNRAQTVLTAAINNSTLTIPVADASKFVANTVVTIENEIISVCTVAGSTLTACAGGRGFDGSSAATHGAGKAVAAQVSSYYHNRTSRELQATQQYIYDVLRYNVKRYGAKGDGATNDAAAINTCLAVGKVTCSLPEGTFYLGGTALSWTTGANLVGAGADKTILKCGVDGAGKTLFFNYSGTPSPQATIAGLTIDNSSCPTRQGMELTGFGYGLVSDVSVLGGQDGIRINNGSGYSSVRYSTVNGATRYGVWINGDSSGEVTLDHTIVYSSNVATDSGIRVDKAGSVDLGGVYVSKCRVYGGAGAMTYGFIYNSTSTGFTYPKIIDSVFETPQYPIYLKNALYGEVLSSWANSYGGLGGITLDGGQHVNISGNKFVGGGYGIVFKNNGSDFSVVGNEFADVGATMSFPGSNPPVRVVYSANKLSATTSNADQVKFLAASVAPDKNLMGPTAFVTDRLSADNTIKIYDASTATFKFLRADAGCLDVVNQAFTQNVFQICDDGKASINGVRLGPDGRYNVMQYGGAGNGTTDDTSAVQAAIAAACFAGGGDIFFPAGAFKLTNAASNCSNVSFSGVRGQSTIKISAATLTTVYGLDIEGISTATTATTTTNLALNQRSLQSVRTIGFSSVTGFAVGDLVNLYYDDGTYHFEQPNVIQGISVLNVTFVDPIVIPLLTTQTGNITKLTPLSNVSVRDLAFDCSASSSTATSIMGLRAVYLKNSSFENLTFTGCSLTSGSASGLYAYSGWRNRFSNVKTYSSGSASIDAIAIYQQSRWTGQDLSADNGPTYSPSNGSFGIGIHYSVLGAASNSAAGGNARRNIKLLGAGYNNLSNVQANTSTAATGFSFTGGSYRNIVNGLTALASVVGTSNGVGVWFSNEDNQYNVIRGLNAFGNTSGSDLNLGTTDCHNSVYGSWGTGPNNDTGCNYLHRDEGGSTIIRFGCTGTVTASSTLYMADGASQACVNTAGATPEYRWIAPRDGMLSNLQVVAGTGGVNGSSGVVTVATLGITCTLGTGTSCEDVTHNYPVTKGTVVRINATSQGADTLANLNISLGFN